MKLVVWNCHQALDKKLANLMKLNPDVAIIPESAKPDLPKLKTQLVKHQCTSSAWTGKNVQKGLGVHTFNEIKIIESTIDSIGGAFTLKTQLNFKSPINLISVWTQGSGYIEEAHKTLEAYIELFKNSDVIFAGDFNSNRIWDKKHKPNHSDLVNRLSKEFDLESCYHNYHQESHGKETRGTIYFTYNEKKPYHIDYIFIPRKWISKVRSVEVGVYEDWSSLSDHCPLVLDLNL